MDSKSLLKTICQIYNNNTKIAVGGVYISDDGTIATCNQVVTAPDGVKVDILVKLPGKDPKHKNSWIQAGVLISCPSMDIAILSTNQQNCNHVYIPKKIDLKWDDELWSVSQMGSISDARVAYPFSSDIKLPDVDVNLTGAYGVSILDKPVPLSLEVRHYTPKDLKTQLNLQSNLPLIKVNGGCMRKGDKGASGCPLFLKENMEFLGILSFVGNTCSYYVPSTLIGKLISIREKEEGNTWLKKRNYPKAIGCYSKSIDLYPNAAAFADRALVYLNENKYQEAENDYTESLKLDANNIKVYWRRAQARKELGNLKEALEDVELGLKLEPENGQVKKLRDELKSMLEKVPNAGSESGAEGAPCGMDVKAEGI